MIHACVWFYINHMNYTELVRKFRGVLVVQNDDVMRSESQGVKTFVTDAQALIRRFDSPTPSDLAIRYMAGFVVRRLQKQLDAKDIDMLIESDEATIQFRCQFH